MIKDIHDKIVSELVTPKFVVIVRVHDNRISFHVNTDVDTRGIDIEDPIVSIITQECIRVDVNYADKKCAIRPYSTDASRTVMRHVHNYLLWFLREHQTQKNPRVTKLYKWMDYFSNNIHTDEFNTDQLLLFKYLKTNVDHDTIGMEGNVHVKNGLGILKTLQAKYENLGFELKEHHGKRRRRHW